MPNIKNIIVQEKSQISFCKILKNKWYHAKVLLKRFHLNGHTIGFHQQMQKLEPTLQFSITDPGSEKGYVVMVYREFNLI